MNPYDLKEGMPQFNVLTYKQFKKFTSPTYIREILPIVTEEDYANGYKMRYFVKQANNIQSPVYEVNQEQFEKVTGEGSFYKGIVFRWAIIGTEQYIGETNLVNISNLESKMPGLKIKLGNRVLQYSKPTKVKPVVPIEKIITLPNQLATFGPIKTRIISPLPPGPPVPTYQHIFSVYTATLSAAQDFYSAFSGQATSTGWTTTDVLRFPVLAAFTLSNLSIRGNSGSSVNVYAEIMKNGIATVSKVTTVTTSLTIDTINSVAFVPGDELSLHIHGTGGTLGSIIITAYMVYNP